jgi:hypothetical protein
MVKSAELRWITERSSKSIEKYRNQPQMALIGVLLVG